jgi:uridine kinase
LFIGVAGGSGSGKTTVAEEIIRRIGPERLVSVHQDRYYRDLSHLELLRAGSAAPLPVYDFAHHVRTDRIEWAEPRPVVLVEGILILAVATIRNLLDIKLFVDTDADVRLIRRIRRDLAERGRTVESVNDQWMATVRPMHLEFVEPSKRWADLIIPEGGYNTVALDLVISRIERVLDA